MTELSVVVPVYRSERLVGAMIARTLAVFDAEGLDGELVLVHDAGPDASWSVLEEWAGRDERVTAIDLRENEGQHQALLVGLAHARGAWLATLDDDLQNPPECLPLLLAAGRAGHDLVFGRFERKRHSGTRVLASRVVTLLDRLLYGLPRGMVVSNVRLMSRAVAEGTLALETRRNYLTGLALHCAASPANVDVPHEPRPEGGSSYSLGALLRLFGMLLVGHPRLVRLRRPARPLAERVRCVLSAAPRRAS